MWGRSRPLYVYSTRNSHSLAREAGCDMSSLGYGQHAKRAPTHKRTRVLYEQSVCDRLAFPELVICQDTPSDGVV